MLNIALELSKHRRSYEDIASKFFEHFILISDAMSYRSGDEQASLWNEADGFYYDAISWGGPFAQQLPIRSLVGLIPLFAVLTLEPELINKFPSFKRRLNWFIENRHDVAERNIASLKDRGKDDRMLLSLVNKDRLVQILKRMLDESEFLSPNGIRSLSKFHEKNPYAMDVNGQHFQVSYIPGDSDSGLFGGNRYANPWFLRPVPKNDTDLSSNWRGPIWLAVNFLLVESLLRFYMFYGKSLQVECPTGSGIYLHLGECAEEIQHRLQHLFARGDDGRRAINDGNDLLDFDPHWKEFFDGDTGRGLGATHQCGWTGLISKIINDAGINCRLPQTPRTPTAAAAHFADSYFDEIFARPNNPRIRRSSVSRSIGNHNTSVNGDERAGSETDTEERARDRNHANQHVANYVTDQLERVRSNESVAAYEDEFEAQIDGQ